MAIIVFDLGRNRNYWTNFFCIFGTMSTYGTKLLLERTKPRIQLERTSGYENISIERKVVLRTSSMVLSIKNPLITKIEFFEHSRFSSTKNWCHLHRSQYTRRSNENHKISQIANVWSFQKIHSKSKPKWLHITHHSAFSWLDALHSQWWRRQHFLDCCLLLSQLIFRFASIWPIILRRCQKNWNSFFSYAHIPSCSVRLLCIQWASNSKLRTQRKIERIDTNTFWAMPSNK